MKTKFIISFNCNRKRSYYKYKIEKFADEIKLNQVNGFNEKVVGLITIPYSKYLEDVEYIKNRFKQKECLNKSE